MFWREVKRARNSEKVMQVNMKEEDGRILTEENEVYERCFEVL